jgi:diacylglycerol kinase family enzyme
MIVVVANPAAGRGAAARAIPELQRLLAHGSEHVGLRRTTAPRPGVVDGSHGLEVWPESPGRS